MKEDDKNTTELSNRNYIKWIKNKREQHLSYPPCDLKLVGSDGGLVLSLSSSLLQATASGINNKRRRYFFIVFNY